MSVSGLGRTNRYCTKKYLLSKSLSLLSLSSTYIRSADSKLSEENFFPLKCKFFLSNEYISLSMLFLMTPTTSWTWAWAASIWFGFEAAISEEDIGDWCDDEAIKVSVAHILKTFPKALRTQALTALTNLHILHNLLIQRQSGFNTSLYFPTRSFMRQGQTASVKNRQYSKSLLFRPIVREPFKNVLADFAR